MSKDSLIHIEDDSSFKSDSESDHTAITEPCRNDSPLLESSDVQKQVAQTDKYRKFSEVIYLEALQGKVIKKVLTVFDILISLFVVTPLVVAGWRGTWQLLDIYKDYFPPWESFWVGIGAHVVLALAQDAFHNSLIDTSDNIFMRILACILKKLYTIAFNIITNMQWRAGWILLDQWFEVKYYAGGQIPIAATCKYLLIFCGMCTIILGLMKCLNNVNSPPFQIVHDNGESMFLFPNMFKTKIAENTSLYIMDCLFSVLIVGTLVVFVWRGLWVIVDIFLFPEDEVLSAWGSLLLGYIIVALVFVLQPLMKSLCSKLDGAPRLLAADFFIIVSLIGTINVWRGIWNLLNIYFLPENPELSCWITLWLSLFLLIMLGCSNSLLVRGVYIDAEEPGGKCVVFPCYYLRIIFEEEKMKRLALRRMKMTEKTGENNHVFTISCKESGGGSDGHVEKESNHRGA